MGDGVLHAVFGKRLNGTQRFETPMGGPLFLVAVETLVDGKVSPPFKLRFFQEIGQVDPSLYNTTNTIIISPDKYFCKFLCIEKSPILQDFGVVSILFTPKDFWC